MFSEYYLSPKFLEVVSAYNLYVSTRLVILQEREGERERSGGREREKGGKGGRERERRGEREGEGGKGGR